MFSPRINKYDCLVIGGGLIGMLTARELAQGGGRVALLERGETGREASWAGGGILSPLYPWRYPESVTRLATWGQVRYEALAKALAEESGVDPQWTPNGLLMLDVEDGAAACAWAERFGADLMQIDAVDLHGLEPRLGPQAQSGWWMPAVAQIRNPRLVRALRGSLEALGVTLMAQCEVNGFLYDGDRVTGVETRVSREYAEAVIVAAGAWSARLLAETGLSLQVEPVRGQMLLFRGPAGRVARIVLSQDRYVIPRRDGRVLVGSTTERVGFDKAITAAARTGLRQAALRLIPALADYPIEHHWAGLRPGSPDGVPGIGPHPGLRGLYLNTGHYRNGVVLGPASARLTADWVLGREPCLDPAPYCAQFIENK